MFMTLCYHSETTDSKLFDSILELVAGGCGYLYHVILCESDVM